MRSETGPGSEMAARKNENNEMPLRATRGRANPVDVHVGARVRMRRTLLGLSQEKLGDALGLTFQQVQKYERGANRIGASRLYQISQVLDVPVSYFFDELPNAVVEQSGPSQVAESGDMTTGRDPMAKRETLELVRAYYRIFDPRIRRKVFELVKSLGHAS